MALILPARYRTQPTGPAHIDWNHPLARGLVYFVIGNTGADLVNYSPIQRIGGGTLGHGRAGNALVSGSDTADGWYTKYDKGLFRTISDKMTMACDVDITTFASNGKLIGIPLVSSGYTAPFYVASLGASTTLTRVFLSLHPGAGAGGTPTKVQFAANSMTAPGSFHYIISRDGTTPEGLINGAVSTPLSNTWTANPVAFSTGETVSLLNRSNYSTGEGVTGRVYYAAIWNRALSLEEKKAWNENPYQVLIPQRSVLYSLASILGQSPGITRSAEAAISIPMQAATGAATSPNIFDAPTTWTTISGPGTVDTSDSPPTIAINAAGGTSTTVRKQQSTALTVGADYRFSFTVSGLAVNYGLGTTNGGQQYRSLATQSSAGSHSFEFRATSTALWIQFQRLTAGTTTMTNFSLQQIASAPSVNAAAAISVPMQALAGTATNGGAFAAAAAISIPMQAATGAAAFVSTTLEAAGAIAIPMQAATGAAIQPPSRALTGAATIAMQQAGGAMATRYNFARVLNGSNQHFEYVPSAGTQSNRNLAFYGWVRFDTAPAPSGSYYVVDYGNLTASGTGGAGRVRIIYDNSSQQFVGSTGDISGTAYREARSAVTPIVVSRFYFVGLSIDAAGVLRLTVGKARTTGSGTLPASSTNICNVFRLGTTSRTVPAGRVTGAYGAWALCPNFVPADADVDLFADGYWPGNIPGLAASSLWMMSESGTTEPDRQGARTLSAVNSPPRSLLATPFHFGAGTATLPMQQPAGTFVFIGAGTFGIIGSATIPMQTVAGTSFAEEEGVRGNWVIPIQVAAGEGTRTIPAFLLDSATTIPMQRASGTASNGTDSTTTYYVSTITNNTAGLSLVDQEVRVGLPCKIGNVPSGWIVRAFVNGSAVKTQISRRRFWPDGSLKYGEASFLMPVLSPSQTVNVEWRKTPGTWIAQDTGLHSGPTAIINNLSVEWRATSWVNRPTPTTLGTEAGPLSFRIRDMLDATNSAWIRTVYAGHLVTEWEASIFGRRPDGTFHPTFAAKVYVRAWGGTAAQPKRVEFGFKSMYGWDDNSVPSDAHGFQASWDLFVNGTAIRGSSIGTAGWTNVNGFKGGGHFSFGSDGRLDWYDVAAGALISPPALVHKHRMAYLIDGRFLPPLDLTNTFDNSTAKKTISYIPGTRGFTNSNMSDVGDRDDIGWPLTGWTCRTVLAHGAAVSINDTMLHQQVSRIQALAVGSIPCQGYRKTTRGIVPHAPTDRIPDARLLPTLLNSFPESSNAGSYTGYITLDEAHFPQLAYFNYLISGDHHALQLLYGEAGAPASFTSPAFGKSTGVLLYNQPGTPDFPVGHQVIRGQIRGIARHVTQIGTAVGIGHPDDLEHIYYSRQLEDWCIASAQVPPEEDMWRGGTRHVDNFIYRSANDPIYKPWMHSLVTGATAFIAGLTKRPDITERAEWWVTFPKLALGGYNGGDDPDKVLQGTLYTSDELYYVLNNGDANASRVPFSIIKQWGTPITVTYGIDGQTVTVGSTVANHDGAVFTPFNSATPAGLTRGQKYYAVETAGAVNNRGGTLKLSLTIGGEPVSFTAASPISATAIYRSSPAVIASPLSDGLNSGQNNGFGLQMIGALKAHYHAVGADDVIEAALQYIEPYKITGGGGWAEKAKYAVLFEDTAPVLYQVFHNGDPVYYGDDEVWSTIPTGTYNGNFTIPMMLAGGVVEFVPGLDGDSRGAITIPMQLASGEAEAPEVVFSVSGVPSIPMQQVVGTLTGQAPGRAVAGAAAIPMQAATGAMQFAPNTGLGNALVPMQQATGTATSVLPVALMDGAATVPMQTLAGELFFGGVPAQGVITIPMIQATGEALSEQFAYAIEGDFITPMITATGEAFVNAFDASGGVTIPMQAINGIIEFFIDGANLTGDFAIPMIQIETAIDSEEMEDYVSGGFSIPMPVLEGLALAANFQGLSGAITIPMITAGGSGPTSWTEVPRTRNELWTTISPT